MRGRTSTPTARLFVAVDLSPEVCDRLAAWARTAVRELGVRGGGGGSASMRVLDPELLHVTVCFLGNRPVEEIAAIGTALKECRPTRPSRLCAPDRLSVGELSIGAPLWLPPRRPRALAVEVRDDPAGSLAALHRTLVETLALVCGYREQRRRFRAHVTLVRLREAPRGTGGGRALPATPALSFTPASVVLYRSWLSPAGASYEALATRTLIPS